MVSVIIISLLYHKLLLIPKQRKKAMLEEKKQSIKNRTKFSTRYNLEEKDTDRKMKHN